MLTPSGLDFRRFTIAAALVSLTVLVAAGCAGGADPTPTPTTPATVPGAATPTPTAPEAPTPTPSTLVVSTPTPTGPGEVQTTPTPGLLALEVMSPQDGAGIEIGAVRVFGRTRADAVVGVNGTPVAPSADGTFQHDVLLDPGVNLIEVVATDISGAVASQQIAVFAVTPTAALPLSLFYPPDGLEVDQPRIRVMGGSRQDAVVGVNGTPAEINRLGIFAAAVLLEPGANLIEVVAADISGNVSFQTVVVFRSP